MQMFVFQQDSNKQFTHINNIFVSHKEYIYYITIQELIFSLPQLSNSTLINYFILVLLFSKSFCISSINSKAALPRSEVATGLFPLSTSECMVKDILSTGSLSKTVCPIRDD